MSRREGTLKLSSNIEPRAAAPLDARTIVPTLADLTASGAFPYPYVGMIVSVQSEGKAYMLTASDTTVLANWTEIGSGNSGEYKYTSAVTGGLNKVIKLSGIKFPLDNVWEPITFKMWITTSNEGASGTHQLFLASLDLRAISSDGNRHRIILTNVGDSPHNLIYDNCQMELDFEYDYSTDDIYIACCPKDHSIIETMTLAVGVLQTGGEHKDFTLSSVSASSCLHQYIRLNSIYHLDKYKEWTGTHDEWDNLTSAEKAVYDGCKINFTDDDDGLDLPLGEYTTLYMNVNVTAGNTETFGDYVTIPKGTYLLTVKYETTSGTNFYSYCSLQGNAIINPRSGVHVYGQNGGFASETYLLVSDGTKQIRPLAYAYTSGTFNVTYLYTCTMVRLI